MDLELLKKVSLFEGLAPAQLAKVGALLVEREVPVGQHIFKEGESGTDFFVVLSGKVRISKMVPGVGEEALAILEPGAYFGEMALVDDTPRSADALAHNSCKLGVFGRDDFDQLMFMDKEIAYSVLWTFVRTLSTRLRETNEKIKGFFALSARF
jgi:CRP/FNR family cyclic AMP-dependent transcriptional regulator